MSPQALAEAGEVKRERGISAWVMMKTTLAALEFGLRGYALTPEFIGWRPADADGISRCEIGRIHRGGRLIGALVQVDAQRTCPIRAYRAPVAAFDEMMNAWQEITALEIWRDLSAWAAATAEAGGGEK